MSFPALSPDRLIAHGRTADVYEWGDQHILKLFHDWYDLESIEYELNIVNAVRASGIQTPKILEPIVHENKHGLIYERVKGEPMQTILQRKPWMALKYSRWLARLQKQMHEHPFNADIPDQHSKLRNKINRAKTLSASLKDSLLDALDLLPAGDRVCHGDFHPANVLVAGTNAIVIDWVDASIGNPFADLARTSIIILGDVESGSRVNPFEKTLTKLFHRSYLNEYFKGNPSARNEYLRWLPIVAAARLSEEIPELETWLARQAGRVV